jgi:hypothetical protein
MKTVELRATLPDEFADRLKEVLRGDEGDWERLRQLVAETPEPKREETLTFRTPNLTLEEFAALSDQEANRITNEAYEANHEWVDREWQQRGAIWIAVIDGEVIASSPRINFPNGPRIRELGAATGKQAFIFVDKSRFVIEESVGWNATRHAGDYYPTVPLTVVHESASSSVSLVAHFDTGSNYTYLPFEGLAEQGVVQRDPNEKGVEFFHLGEPFFCLSRFVRAQLENSSPLQEQDVVCVLDWQSSPFVQVNPQRAALVGRDLPAAMQSKIELDFEARTTMVHPRRESEVV